MPGEPGSYSGYIYYPAAIYTHLAGQTLGSSSTNEVQASLMVKLILQKLEDCQMEGVAHVGHLLLRSTKYIYQQSVAESMENYLQYMLYQRQCLTGLAPLITEHYHDLVTVLTPQRGYVISFRGADLSSEGAEWVECSECGDVSFALRIPDDDDMRHRQCQQSPQGIYKVNSPRLLTAYSTARKGRFEEFF